MKIQLSPTRIIKDVTTVWFEHGPEVDIVMDLKKLTFAPNSIDAIFAFHVLDHFFPQETIEAMINWRRVLKPGGNPLFIIVDNFEYIARGFVGGDVSINVINDQHATPTHFTQDNLTELGKAAGYHEDHMKIWFMDVPGADGKPLVPKKEWELIISAEKYEPTT